MEHWKQAFEETCDPMKLKAIAAKATEVEAWVNFAACAGAPTIGEACRALFAELGGQRFKRDEMANGLAERTGLEVLQSKDECLMVLEAAAEAILRRKNAAKSAEKADVLKDIAAYCNLWKTVFSDDGEAKGILAAGMVDEALRGQHGPMAVADAVRAVKRSPAASGWPYGDGELQDITQWYLATIRVKYRKDFELTRSQEKCGKCGEMKPEGEACGRCAEAERALERARSAEKSGDWNRARTEAGEVLKIWPGDGEAKRIEAAAAAALAAAREAEGKVRAAEKALEAALGKTPPDTEEARRLADGAKDLPGFDGRKWEKKISDAEEAVRRAAALGAAEEKFRGALRRGAWAEAEEYAADVARLGGDSTGESRKKIAAAKAERQTALASDCDEELKKAEGGVSGASPSAETLDAAAKALAAAKEGHAALRKEFPRAKELENFAARIRDAERKLKEAESAAAVRSLRPAEGLSASGSSSGAPSVTVAWRAGRGGKAPSGWEVRRREKGGADEKVVSPFTTGTEFRDEGSGLKLATWYEYGVAPVLSKDDGRRVVADKARTWSAAAGCSAKLDPAALKGRGEGEPGAWGRADLTWTLPAGLERGSGNMKLTLRRKGGAAEDVTGKGGHWEDKGVSVGTTYEYTLELAVFGKPAGQSTVQVEVKKLAPPPAVADLRLGRAANGMPEARWTWPAGLETCIWGVTGREPKTLADLPRECRTRLGRPSSARSAVRLARVPSGEQWLAVFGVRGAAGTEVGSPPKCLRIDKAQVTYSVEGGGLFGWGQPCQLLVKSTLGTFPDLEVRAGTRSEVLNREGRVLEIPSWTMEKCKGGGGWAWRCSLEGLAEKGEHVRLFLIHPERQNCEIRHPRKLGDSEVR